MLRLLMSASLLLVLQGCGGYITKWGDSFEGANDYGYVGAKDEVVKPKYEKSEGGVLVEGDYVSFHLKSVYLNYFPEGSLKRKANSLVGSKVRGEIAVLIDVVDSKVAGIETAKTGRVIYYGDDVYEGQMLNLSFLPIYGPVKYSGQSLGFTLRMLELDQADNEQVKGVLSALAKVGSSFATAGAPNLIKNLSDVGGALVASNADDKFAAYDAMFLPAGKDHGAASPNLKLGDYVFVRNADRSKMNLWAEYCYLHETGELRKKINGSCTAATEKPNFNYAVISVLRDVGQVDMTPETKFNELVTKLASVEKISTMDELAGAAVRGYASDAGMSKVRRALSVVSKKESSPIVRSYNAFVLAQAMQCSLLSRRDMSSEAEEQAAVKVCGKYYADIGLRIDDAGYVADRLGALSNCVPTKDFNEDFFIGEITEASLKEKLNTVSNRLSLCGS